MDSGVESHSEPTAIGSFVERTEQLRLPIIFAAAYATQVAYLRLEEHQPLVASLLHPVLNPLNLSIVSPDYIHHGVFGVTAAIAGGVVYVAAGAGAAGVLAKTFERDAQFRAGDGTIGNGIIGLNHIRFGRDFAKWKDTVGIRNPVILAQDEDALPIFSDLIAVMSGTAEPNNIVLFKAGHNATLQQGEEVFHHRWVASRGNESFIDTDRWHRTGAFEAKIIVVNTKDLSTADEVFAVVRDQLGNESARFLIVVTDPKEIPDGATETGLLKDDEGKISVTSQYLAVIRELSGAVDKKNADRLIPSVDESIVNKKYIARLEKKRKLLDNKFAVLAEKIEREDRKIRIAFHGDLTVGEGLGLKNAVEKYVERFEIVKNSPDIELVFGNGYITDDMSALRDAKEILKSKHSSVIRLGVVYRRNNMDNMIRHVDGVLSFEASLTALMQEELRNAVEYKVGLWKRLTALVNRSKIVGKRV